MNRAALAAPENDGFIENRNGERLGCRKILRPARDIPGVADKSELLGLMARDIYATAYASVPAAPDWRNWLLHFGYALRKAFAAHRDGARLCATARAPSAPSIADHAQAIAAPLVALHLTEKQALSFQASVISFALGWASFEANGPMHDYLDELLDFDASFEIGLQALVSGFTI